MVAVDFFCGAGGATRGLKDAGVSVLAAIDLDAKCGDTYSYNNPDVRMLTADVRSNLVKVFISSVCDGVSRESLLYGLFWESSHRGGKHVYIFRELIND